MNSSLRVTEDAPETINYLVVYSHSVLLLLAWQSAAPSRSYYTACVVFSLFGEALHLALLLQLPFQSAAASRSFYTTCGTRLAPRPFKGTGWLAGTIME